jgi:xanthine dehydrogenase small subunit
MRAPSSAVAAIGDLAVTPDATVRFYLNGALTTLPHAAPTETILDFLRLRARLTGTKEGCGEGDCGACSIIVCALDASDALAARAVNSCLAFLPMLDGTAVLTVEGLAEGGTLHPVQQSLVDLHASQCGFCTPGFVVALAAFAATGEAPEDATLHDALAGNLCRCTGYRPILDAARTAHPAAAAWWRGRGEAIRADLLALKRETALATGEGGTRYFAPTSAAAAATLLAQYPDARIVAGATDLGLAVSKHKLDPPVVISLGAAADLRCVEIGPDVIRLGAGTTHGEALPALDAHFPSLGTLIRRFGSRQIRNLGTIGGNLATASPIGDLPPTLLALGATLDLRSERGARTIAVDDFFTGYRKTALARDELIAAISLPRLRPGQHFRTYKISKRYDQDISTVCGAFLVALEKGRIAAARLAYGGMASTPKRAAGAERALIGKAFVPAAIEAAVQALAGDFTPLSDFRGGAAYRQRIAANLLRRFYLDASASGERCDVAAL